MATNADTAEEELRQAKEEEVTKTTEPEAPDESTEETAQSGDESTEEEASAESTFTKLVPSIGGDSLEEHAALVAKAYGESTKEALRLKGELDKISLSKAQETAASQTGVLPDTDTETELTPEQLYIRGKQKEETDKAFADISQNYPQVLEQENYQKFVTSAAVFGRAILLNEKRFASPAELYRKTVIDLGWDKDDSKERLGAALKDGATSTRTGVSSGPGKSKVTDEMISLNQRMYPGKSRAEIIKELEPHIN